MKNQKGFTLIEVLLVIIALSMVGGVGYYVYNSQKKDNKAVQDISTQQKLEEKSSEKKTDYLEIEPLGVKIKLSDSFKGIKYIIPQENEVAFYTEELRELEKKCFGDDPNNPPATGVFISVRKVSGVHKTREASEDFFLKQFDGFYLDGSYGNLGCIASPDQELNDKFKNLSQTLYEQGIDALKNSELL